MSRLLGKPDYTYRGMVFSDGIIDSNMKVVPLQTEESQNATNMFRQCLFMIEIEQECAVNKKATKLLRQKADIEARRSKMIADSGGEGNLDHSLLASINDELRKVIIQIEENEQLKVIQDENNNYEQKFRSGNKLTYGAPFQLRHLFSNQYLSLNTDEMSQEYGCCEVHLSETKEESVFVMEPQGGSQNLDGYVVNYSDFFNIKS